MNDGKDMINIFPKNNIQKEKLILTKQIEKNEKEKDKSFNEQRIQNKLSLRKKKIEDIISSKRACNLIDDIYGKTQHTIISYTKNDFISGDIYKKLKEAYESNDTKNLIDILYNIAQFFNSKTMEKTQIEELFMKSGYNYTNNGINKNEKYPFAFLILNIGLNTEDKIVYIYSFNLVLNFAYSSNDFCLEIYSEKIICLIFQKLIHFYPLFIESNNTIENIENDESSYLAKFNNLEKVESLFIGGQIIKLLGNLYIATDNYGPFITMQFYDKIFDLTYAFYIDESDVQYKHIYFEFLDILVWLLIVFIQTNPDFIVDNNDKILRIIPKLYDNIKKFYFTQEAKILNNLLELLDILGDSNMEILAQMVDADAIKNLSYLFSYLFNTNNIMNQEIILNPDITEKILDIFINIFTLDSEYFKNVDDYLTFSMVIEKLISIYKYHSQNHFEIQTKLITLLGNLACFDDIENIVKKIINKNNIVKDLFKYYYPHHKVKVVFFIYNVMAKQAKSIRDFILDLGAFDILKNDICNYNNGTELELMIECVKALHQLITQEKSFNIRALFEKLYNTAIPDKIKELVLENDLNFEAQNILKSLVTDFETYEKSLEED